LAIGDPADGYFAIRLIRQSRGWAEAASDDEIRAGIQLLAETEGIFAETAGGVTVAVTQKLLEQGHIGRDQEVVLCITGHGLKTPDAVVDALEPAPVIEAKLEEFAALVADDPIPAASNPPR
jgi:threonine synthase